MAEPEIANVTEGVKVDFVVFSTTFAHQIFLLVSTAFLLFELTFLWFYSDRSWFVVDLIPFCIPAALTTVIAAHFSLAFWETPRGCRSTAWLSKGMPLAAYRRWVTVNEPGFPRGIRFGDRRAIWSAIDAAELTFFGNLLLKSRASSGAVVKQILKGKERDLNPPQLIFKVPFGLASRPDQMRLMDMLRKENPECLLNDRLLKQVAKDEPKGSAMILNIVSACFVLFFVDVCYSTFSYLEMLKQYTLAQESAQAKDSAGAELHFKRGEELRLKPLPISFVTKKMFQTASTKAGVMQIRADALWEMNKRQEAIDSMHEALEEHTKNFRAELKLARMLLDYGKPEEASSVLHKAMDKSKKALVPRAYVLAVLSGRGAGKEPGKEPGQGQASTFYGKAMKEFDEELFKDSTGWPPGVSPYFPDVWHRDDVEFVFRRMLDGKQ